jgi:hypothetical protein
MMECPRCNENMTFHYYGHWVCISCLDSEDGMSLAKNELARIKPFYCPACGFECSVAFLGNTDFQTCECDECSSIMLEK